MSLAFSRSYTVKMNTTLPEPGIANNAQKRFKKAIIGSIISENDNGQLNYRTRARRKAAFSGLSKQVIRQSELEDLDAHKLPEIGATKAIAKDDSSSGEDETDTSSLKKSRSQRKSSLPVQEECFEKRMSMSTPMQRRNRKSANAIGSLSGAEISCMKKEFKKRKMAGAQKRFSKLGKTVISAQLVKDNNSPHQEFSPVLDEQTFFCCPKCCIYFRKEDFEKYRNHIRETCVVKKTFPCEHCGHIYSSKSVRNFHIDSVHKKPHPMSKTVRVKPRKEYVSEMTRIHTLFQKDTKVNDSCNKGGCTNSPIEQRRPEFKGLLEKMQKELVDDNWPINHKSAESMGKSSGLWKCWVCFYESHKKAFWLTHTNRVHPNAKGISLLCSHCKFPFTRKHHLREHLHEVHMDKTGHECSKCGRIFLHKNSQHVCEKIQCDICNETFNSRGQRTKHMLTHEEYQPYSCETCDKTFQKQEYLSLHIRTHKDIRPYHCEFCTKMFRLKCHYNNHRRTHTGEKPYVCYTCGKSFASPQCLSSHLPSHEENKRFSCNICNKSFRTEYDVKRHEEIHKGDKPFLCKICGKAFNRKGNCIAHERNHIEKGFTEPYTCNICGEKFARPKKLETHLLNSHEEAKHEKRPLTAISSENPVACTDSNMLLEHKSTEPIHFEISMS